MLKRKQPQDFASPAKKKQKPTYLPERTPPPNESARYVSPDYVINCAFIGDAGIGKTSLMKMLGERISSAEQNSLFDRYVAQITSREGEQVHVSYWDVSSSDDHSRMRSLTYRMNHIFFLCFSTVDRHSFENAKLQWFPEIDLIVPEAPVYLIGTQTDLRDQLLAENPNNISKVVTQEDAEQLRSSMGAIMYLETSVNSAVSLTRVMKQVASAMLRETEHQAKINHARSQKAWIRSCNAILGKDPSCMSPKKNHKNDVQKAKPRESVAILSPKRSSNPIKQLTKLNVRKSFLSPSADSPTIEEKENTNSPLPGGSFTPTKQGKPRFELSLKHLRNRLLGTNARTKPVETAPVHSPAVRLLSRWSVRDQAYEPFSGSDSRAEQDLILHVEDSTLLKPETVGTGATELILHSETHPELFEEESDEDDDYDVSEEDFD